MSKQSAEQVTIEEAAKNIIIAIGLLRNEQGRTNEILKHVANLLDTYQSTLVTVLDLNAKAKREELFQKQEQAKKLSPTEYDLKY